MLTWAAVVAVFLLMSIGNVVSATGSGLACPDWPLCHGQPDPPAPPRRAHRVQPSPRGGARVPPHRGHDRHGDAPLRPAGDPAHGLDAARAPGRPDRTRGDHGAAEAARPDQHRAPRQCPAHLRRLARARGERARSGHPRGRDRAPGTGRARRAPRPARARRLRAPFGRGARLPGLPAVQRGRLAGPLAGRRPLDPPLARGPAPRSLHPSRHRRPRHPAGARDLGGGAARRRPGDSWHRDGPAPARPADPRRPRRRRLRPVGDGGVDGGEIGCREPPHRPAAGGRSRCAEARLA